MSASNNDSPYQPVKRLQVRWQHAVGEQNEYAAYLYVPENRLEEYRALREQVNLSEIFQEFALVVHINEEKKWWVWESEDFEKQLNPGGPTPAAFHDAMSQKYGLITKRDFSHDVQTVAGFRPDNQELR